MTQSTVFEPHVLHPGQISDKKPWERQEGESARWHMRFRVYLNLGSKRTVNAAYDAVHKAEDKEKQRKSRTKTGPEWYNAAKRYQWEVRAQAWDKEQDERKAAIMRQIAVKCAFVSRPFRITQLNSMAETLMRELEKGYEPAMFMALTKQMQALMQDINEEVAAWNVTIDAVTDAAALEALEQKHTRQAALQQERDDEMEEEMDFMLGRLEAQYRYSEERKQRYQRMEAQMEEEMARSQSQGKLQ